MAPRTKKQFEEIRQGKKALIMNAALELFANEGYHATSISKIAEKAGISKGLLYNYFESKEALIIQILDQGFAEMFAYFDINKDGVLSKKELAYFIDKSVESLKVNIEFWRFYFRVSLQPEVFPLLKSKIEAIMAPMMKLLVKYFQTQGAKEPTMEAMLFGALLDGISMDYVFTPELIPIDKVKKAIIKKYCS
ncbi:MAG: TetR/AcrR family transcriptional regulator [Ignavibacteriaceae bacterium]|jgi:AcrR family transcriptional regulator